MPNTLCLTMWWFSRQQRTTTLMSTFVPFHAVKNSSRGMVSKFQDNLYTVVHSNQHCSDIPIPDSTALRKRRVESKTARMYWDRPVVGCAPPSHDAGINHAFDSPLAHSLAWCAQRCPAPTFRSGNNNRVRMTPTCAHTHNMEACMAAACQRNQM